MSMSKQDKANETPKALGGIITLYRSTHTAPDDRSENCWYYRFKDPLRPRRYIRKSSKTTELALAKRISIEHYEELKVKSKLGLTTATTTINLLVSKFSRELPKKSQPVAKQLLRKYWLRYFGEQDLSTINDDAIVSYVDWRQDPANYFHNVTKNPRLKRDKNAPVKGVHSIAKATLQAELKYLRFYLRRGFETGRIARLPNQRINYESIEHLSDVEPNKRRGRFTDAQVKVIEQWRREFATAWGRNRKLEILGKEPVHPSFKGHRINRFHRVRFYTVITLATQTGLRPLELKNIRFCDIKVREEDGEKFTYIEVRREVAKKSRNSKGKARIAVCSNMEVMFERLLWYQDEWERMYGRKPVWGNDPDHSDLLFPNTRNVNEPKQLSDLIKAGLERISEDKGVNVHGNFIKDPLYPDGKAWKQNTLYSFRSLYMTRQLKHGTSLYHLSLQVGSSPKTIMTSYRIDEALDYWKYYTSHVRTVRSRKE